MSSSPLLEAKDLAGHRGAMPLFANLGFRVDAGTVLFVTGRNGSGKTTLLRMLAGLTTPAAGEIRLRGETVGPLDEALRASVLFSGHAAALKDELTTEENLDALVRLAGARASCDAIRAVLDELSLGPQRLLPARVLSAGQRRRIGLARLRLVRRPLWVLDEPLTALDAAGNESLVASLRSHLDDGGAAIVATHQPLDVAAGRTHALALGSAA